MSQRHLGAVRRMSGVSALRTLGLMIGGYLIALALLSGAYPKLVLSLASDPLVVRALGGSLVVAGGSLGWISWRVAHGVQLAAPAVVSFVFVASGTSLLAIPRLLSHPALATFPSALAWLLGILGIVALLLARWYGRIIR